MIAKQPVRFLNDVVGEITGYVAIWGTPQKVDAYGTWFDREQPPDMALDFLPFPLMFEHGMDPIVRKDIIGSVEDIWFDATGIAFRALLNRTSRHFEKIVDAIRNELLFTSSATADHTAVWDDQQRFVKWYMVEHSLTESPAEYDMPNVQLTRSAPAGGRDALGTEPGTTPFHLRIGERIMTPLNELLAEDAQGTTPDVLLAALIEQYGQEEIAALMNQAAPPSDTASTEDRADGALVSEITDAVLVAITDEAANIETAIAEAVDTSTDGTLTEDELSALTRAVRKELLERTIRKQVSTPKPAKSFSSNDAAVQKLQEQMNAMLRKQQSAPPVKSGNGGNTNKPQRNISVSSKFDRLSAADLALGYMLMESALPRGVVAPPVSDEYLRALAYKTALLMDKGDAVATDYAVVRSFPWQGRGVSRAAEVMQSTVRAGEVHSGAAGQGAEWIGELQGTDLWEYIRQENMLYDEMLRRGMDEKELPQGFASETIPIEGSDPTWYVAAGAANVDADSGMATPTFASSKMGTGESVVTVAKLSAVMFFQQELVEDSIINIVQEANRKIRVTGAEQIEYILLNGDTVATASTNINLIDGTPAAAPSKPSYMLLNGLMKLPLVTNTANSRDCGAAFSEVDFLQTMALMPGKYRQDRSKLLFVMDSDSSLAAVNIEVFKTHDVYSAATLENGVLSQVYKVDILESGQLAPANTAGKISVTPGNNVFGRLVLVRPDQWASRWKRRIETDVLYDGYSDTTRITAHMRWGLAFRDNEASAITYNIPLSLV